MSSVCRFVHARVSALSAVTERVSPEEQPFDGRCSSCQTQFIDGVIVIPIGWRQPLPSRGLAQLDLMKYWKESTAFAESPDVDQFEHLLSLWPSHYSSVADDQSHLGSIAYVGDLLLHLLNINGVAR